MTVERDPAAFVPLPWGDVVSRARRRRARRAAVSTVAVAAVIAGGAMIAAERGSDDVTVPGTPEATARPLTVADERPATVRPWSDAPVLERSGAAAALVGDEVFVWGGQSGDRPSAVTAADGAMIDVGTGVAHAVATSPLSARTGAAAIAVDGRVLVWGGALAPDGADGAVTGAWYDPADNVWTSLPDSPAGTGRVLPDVVAVGDRVVFGGGVSAGGSVLPDVLVLDRSTMTWSVIETDTPIASIVAVGDRLVGLGTDPGVGTVVTVLDPVAGRVRASAVVGESEQFASLGLADERPTILVTGADGATRLGLVSTRDDHITVDWRDVDGDFRAPRPATGPGDGSRLVSTGLGLVALDSGGASLVSPGRSLIEAFSIEGGVACAGRGASAVPTADGLLIWGAPTCDASNETPRAGQRVVFRAR